MNYKLPTLPMRRIKKVFFIGIGGVGMSGIAEVMLNLKFEVRTKWDKDPMTITLNLPGKHNVLNALASIAIGHEFEISPVKTADALRNFAGIGRRMQRMGTVEIQGGTVEFIDDYGHHPREIAATFDAVRCAWPSKRLVVVFQPHRYSRTKDLFDDFVAVLNQADMLLLLQVYAAGEKVINNADSRALARAMRLLGKLEPVLLEDEQQLAAVVANLVLPNDIVLTLGAGSIGKMAATLPARVKAEAAQ